MAHESKDSRHVLVTGGAGYIGSHACKALARAGYTPVAFDNLVFGHEWAVKWGPLEQGDLNDRARLDAVLEQYRPEAVMHFAAFAFVGESVTDPGKYYRNNVGGSLTLLEAMRDHGIGKLIFSSTCATYGTPQQLPIVETTPQNPINPYGMSKLMVEHMLADFGAAHGLKWVALRYFNASGADPEGGIGECHQPETHLIPLALRAAAGTGPALRLFGSDWPTRDGSCERDFVHVSDLAEAHVRALEGLLAGGPSGAFNLGTGAGHTVREVIAAVERAVGRPVPLETAPRRPGDPAVLVADPSRFQRAYDWSPRLSDLATIVETAWQWERGPARGRTRDP
jgi:UDP-arabinose 4-epimerase